MADEVTATVTTTVTKTKSKFVKWIKWAYAKVKSYGVKYFNHAEALVEKAVKLIHTGIDTITKYLGTGKTAIITIVVIGIVAGFVVFGVGSVITNIIDTIGKLAEIIVKVGVWPAASVAIAYFLYKAVKAFKK
jgi:hypothetical protein